MISQADEYRHYSDTSQEKGNGLCNRGQFSAYVVMRRMCWEREIFVRHLSCQDELRSVRQVNHELRDRIFLQPLLQSLCYEQEDEAEEETNPLHQHHDPKVMHAKTQMQLSFMGSPRFRKDFSAYPP
eukprot:4780261-Amphidinium_carterae.4